MLGPIIYSLAKRKSAKFSDRPRKRGSVLSVFSLNCISFSQAQSPTVRQSFQVLRGFDMSLPLKPKYVFDLFEYGLMEIVFEPTAPGLKELLRKWVSKYKYTNSVDIPEASLSPLIWWVLPITGDSEEKFWIVENWKWLSWFTIYSLALLGHIYRIWDYQIISHEKIWIMYITSTIVCLESGTVHGTYFLLSTELLARSWNSIEKGLLETVIHSETCFPLHTLGSQLYVKCYSIPPPYHSIYLSGKEASSANYSNLRLKFRLCRSLWKPIELINAIKIW